MAATHKDCTDDWARRPPGSMVTMHTVEAHRDATERRVREYAAIANPDPETA